QCLCLILAIEPRVICVGSDTVLPIGPKVARTNGQLVAVMLGDITEIVRKERVLQLWIGVRLIPCRHKGRKLRMKSSIFVLRAVHQYGVRLVGRPIKLRQKNRKRFVDNPIRGGQAEESSYLRVTPGVGEQHLLAVRSLPPEWRRLIPLLASQYRGAILVSTHCPIFDS